MISIKLKWAAIGALLLGPTGSCLGFFLPILLAPQANQGPLLGIFITGPLGALLGALLGVMFSRGLEVGFPGRPPGGP